MTKAVCTCTPAGEEPHCPFHGYEAVIRRYADALSEISDYAAMEVSFDESGWIIERVERAFTSPPHDFTAALHCTQKHEEA